MSPEAGHKRTVADIEYVMRWIIQVNFNKTRMYIPNNIASLAQRVLADLSVSDIANAAGVDNTAGVNKEAPE